MKTPHNINLSGKARTEAMNLLRVQYPLFTFKLGTRPIGTRDFTQEHPGFDIVGKFNPTTHEGYSRRYAVFARRVTA